MKEIALEPGEHVIKATRKHWFVLFLSLLPLAVAAWFPAFLLTILSSLPDAVANGASLPFDQIAGSPFARLMYGLWLLVLWSAAFNFITRYYLNEWIITSTRIISIYQHGFFSREISSVLLVKVQDVNVNVDGIFGTLIGYGQLKVQSAGTSEFFIMDDIPDPGGLRDLIMKEIAVLHANEPQAQNSSAV